MDDEASSEPQVDYPVDCCIKVIGENDDDMRNRIVQALRSVHVEQAVVPGHTSAGGKYITYNIQMTIQDQAQMQRIDAALQKVPGVKFVL